MITETDTILVKSKNNKKIAIEYELKMALSIFFSGLLIFSGIFTVRALLDKKTSQEKNVLYTGKQYCSINYQIALKPNPIYEDQYLKEGGKYITQMVESIPMDMTYNYTGSSEAALTAEYSITAVIESLEQSDDKNTLWSKEFTIQPTTKQLGNTNLEIKKSINVRLKEYNDFLENVISQYKIASKARLIIYFNISVEAQSSKGVYRESIRPYAIVPLLENYLEVSGKLSDEKEGNLENNKTVVIPVDTKMVVLFGSMVGLSILILLMLCFLTYSKNLTGTSKKIDTLLRKHRSRIVNTSDCNCKFIINALRVQTFEDLLRASDELSKPILYIIDSMDFLIISHEICYVYSISEKD